MMTIARRRGLTGSQASLLALGLLAVMSAFLTPGCGNDEGETIIITLIPWTLDFDPSNELFLVERKSLSIWKSTGDNLSGQLLPPSGGGFSPWGIDVGDEDILFVSDDTAARPRLLALSTDFTDAVPLGPETLLAEVELSEIHPDDPIPVPRAVESLALAPGTFRVFLAAGAQVLVFDYSVTAERFSYWQTLAGGCGFPFEKPQGLAVDVLNRRLYVVDGGGNDRLYQFSGIDGILPAVCDDEVDQSEGVSFDNPVGVAAWSDEPAPEDNNKIVVADADNQRLVAFFSDGAEILPDYVEPSTTRRPFDVAFAPDGKLWATYP
jgi:DNA-binding beta-propeller fold protein YncE